MGAASLSGTSRGSSDAPAEDDTRGSATGPSGRYARSHPARQRGCDHHGGTEAEGVDSHSRITRSNFGADGHLALRVDARLCPTGTVSITPPPICPG